MMRIVEQAPDTTRLAYRVLRGLGVVAACFSAIVLVLMVANTWRLKSADPIHSAALRTLVEQMKASPQDAALRNQIRDLDLLARSAFFGSQHFNQVATWLLVGGLVLAVVSFKSLATYTARVPYPNPADPKDVPAENARWARQSVMAVALVLLGLALTLALPWRSPLDDAAQDGVTPEKRPVTPATSRVADGVATPVPPTQPKPVSEALPGREERLKHWPSLRGAASGMAVARTAPVEWNGKAGTGIAWKTPIPLSGFGSPIVWGDRIFFAGGTKEQRRVYGVDAAKGAILWEREVKATPGTPPPSRDISDDTGYAASTMTTDGIRVFAMFATGDLAAFRLDGTPAWSRHLGVPDISFGYGASLETHGDLLIVQMDQEKEGFVVGIDVKTGAPRWKTPRDFGPSWASPLVTEVGGRSEIILPGVPALVAYDPANGRETWRVECFKQGDLAPTPVYSDGLLFVAAERASTSAIDVKTHQVVWSNDQDVPAISTPLVASGLLIGGLSDGGIVCLDARTGTKLWLHETKEGFYASPILIGERVYLLERGGRMHVFPLSREGYRPVATPELGEETVTTPALFQNSLIIRGAKHLYRIGP